MWFCRVEVLVTLLLVGSIVAKSGGQNQDNCPELKSPDIKYFDINLPHQLHVPARHTIYVCQQFKVGIWLKSNAFDFDS